MVLGGVGVQQDDVDLLEPASMASQYGHTDRQGGMDPSAANLGGARSLA